MLNLAPPRETRQNIFVPLQNRVLDDVIAPKSGYRLRGSIEIICVLVHSTPSCFASINPWFFRQRLGELAIFCKREKLSGQNLCFVDVLLDVSQRFEDLVVCNARGDQIHIAQDAYQQVVKIMGDVAGEHAEGFQSLSVSTSSSARLHAEMSR